MLLHVIEKELRECIYSYRSLVIFILTLALFMVAVYTGVRSYQTNLQEFRLAQVALRERQSEQSTLFALASSGYDFMKPPLVLSIFVSGVEPHAPQVYNVSLFLLPQARGSRAGENPTLAAFGPLDIFYVVQVVLSLAVLAFTFTTICGEKEMGTLKLQLANSLPKDTLILGKLLGNLVGFLLPVTLAFLVASLMLFGFDGVALSASDALRLLSLALDFLLYLTVFFALGLAVSSVTSRATTAFALCLALWVLLVAIVPKLAALAANRLSPLASLQEFEMKKAEIDRQGSVDFTVEYEKYSREHNNQRPPNDVYQELLARIREQQNRELKKLEDDYLERRARQAQMASLLARFSPAGSAYYAAMDLALTSPARDFRFREALRDYRAVFTSYYDRKASEAIALERSEKDPGGTSKLSFADLPPFQFFEQPLASSMNAALPDLGLLAGWAVVFFLFAYFGFLRYDVR